MKKFKNGSRTKGMLLSQNSENNGDKKLFSDRRIFLKQLAVVTAMCFGPISGNASQRKKHTILLRSSWQTVNIGDIGHTPGALALLYRFLPEAEVILWPSRIDNGVEEMLLKNFPRLKIAKGNVDVNGKPTTEELNDAFKKADFLLHGSGPSVVAQRHMEAWRKYTGKPYGIYGVTIGEVDADLRDLIDHAKLIFCRDTSSLSYLKEIGIKCPVMEFAPDATFGIHLRDDRKADDYLKTAGLKPGEFICVVPRLRHTPYWKIKGVEPTESDRKAAANSEKYREKDHAKLRAGIIKWVEKTGLKVLACPEMTYEVELAKTELVDPLPEDIKKNVIWRDSYWTPDEAASVYAKARIVLSIEMHSPIIAAAMGIPAIHVRQPTDTRKGQMWRDIGLSDWMFEMDDSTGEQLAECLLDIHLDYPAAQTKLAKAMAFVQKRQRESMLILQKNIPS